MMRRTRNPHQALIVCAAQRLAEQSTCFIAADRVSALNSRQDGHTAPSRLPLARLLRASLSNIHMNTSHSAASAGRVRRGAATFPPLLHVLRDPLLYPLFRALIAGQISKLIVRGSYFTFECEGDEVVADDDNLKTVVGAIGVAISNPRLRVTPKRLRGLQGQLTLMLSPAAKQKLLVELAQLLGNMSAHDLEGLPSPLEALQQERGRRGGEGAVSESGYSLGLFEALDSADIIAIDGCELRPQYQEHSASRRSLRLADETDILVNDQQIRIVGGRASFADSEGLPHQIQFSVERQREEEDLAAARR